MFPVLCVNVRNVKILVLIIYIVEKNEEKKILIVLRRDIQLRFYRLREQNILITEEKNVQLVNKELTLPQFSAHLQDKLQNFPRHRHNVTHTRKIYDQVIDALSDGTIIKIQDFSENYTCLLPNEIVSIHWTQEQATVFPVVVLRKVNNYVQEDHFVFISDDLKHDVPFI